MADAAVVARLRRNRDGARRGLIIGMVLLIVFGFGFGFVSFVDAGGAGALIYLQSQVLAFWLVGAILAVCAVSMVAWIYWGWRLRRVADPWAYDPELDGPDPRVRRGLETAERAAKKDQPGTPPQRPP